ncbi:hypothetical protein ZWY2020_053705 [Hordeum vulgare]|nr:hypothetical protein ZWY2020_053705 [Hordeum vulgare]
MAAGSLAVPALLVALLACATARVALVAGGTACDGAVCAMGGCKEVTVIIPFSNFTAYECDCYGPKPPNAANASLLDPCSYNDCGSEGTCVRGVGHQYRCQCNPGATNVKGDTSLPCIKCAVDEKGCLYPALRHRRRRRHLRRRRRHHLNRLRFSLMLASLAAFHAVIV